MVRWKEKQHGGVSLLSGLWTEESGLAETRAVWIKLGGMMQLTRAFQHFRRPDGVHYYCRSKTEGPSDRLSQKAPSWRAFHGKRVGCCFV